MGGAGEAEAVGGGCDLSSVAVGVGVGEGQSAEGADEGSCSRDDWGWEGWVDGQTC